jgi:hypothetical protein
MPSRPNPKDGMGQIVVCHRLHPILGDAGERHEARISVGSVFIRDAINRPVELPIFSAGDKAYDDHQLGQPFFN